MNTNPLPRLLVIILTLMLALPLWAEVPGLINYQGRLTDNLGNPLTGNRTVGVRVYNAASGGQLIYQETIGNVAVSNGAYSFRFGSSGNGLASLLSGQEYLALLVNGIEEVPRTRLLAVPYALRAKQSEDTEALSMEVAETSDNVSTLLAEFRVPEVFGDLSFDNPAGNRTFAIKNNGFGRLTVSDIGYPEGFSGDWGGGVIEPGGERVVTISYDHTSAPPTSYNSSIRVESNATDGKGAIVLSFVVPGNFVEVQGGLLTQSSAHAGASVATFQIGRFEVTWGQWKAVRDWAVANGYSDLAGVGEGGGANHPVGKVGWHDALKWCNAKSQMESLTPVYKLSGGAAYKSGSDVPSADTSANGYRLPTDPEWEWAAQGGSLSQGYIFSGSNTIDAVAWFLGNSNSTAHPAGGRLPNELGLYDMSGNVAEWTSESVSRGGGFSTAFSNSSTPSVNWPPDARYSEGGLRLARNVEKFATVWGGTLPAESAHAGTSVATFQIGRFEVTQAEWERVKSWALANGYSDLANVGVGAGANHPVRRVSWHDALKWCNAWSEMEGLLPVYSVNGTTYKIGRLVPAVDGSANGYRLPTEAEWEWAARGGVWGRNETYSGSNNLDGVGWYLDNTSDLTKPVGSKAPNELGLHDMSGNVWEWAFDLVSPGATNRQLRGGSFAMQAIHCRVVSAGNWSPDARYNDGGLRVTRNLEKFATVWGGTLPAESAHAGTSVATFQIGRFEVTQAEWDAVRTWSLENGYGDLANVGVGAGANHPVRRVSWHDALKWCNAKSEMEGLVPAYTANSSIYRNGNLTATFNQSANGYRLPMEVEWEWAARGGVLGQNQTYSGSNRLDPVGWYLDNTNDLTQPVGSKAPNELGLYDMSGNVWEWAFDLVAPGATNRQLRGGSFAMQASHCRVVSAGNWSPDARYNDGGLRLVRNVGGLVTVWGGALPQTSANAGTSVATFQIGRFEVTQAEWEAAKSWAVANGYSDLANVGVGAGANHPVRRVSWHDALKWCNAKSQMENLMPVYQMAGGSTYKTGQVVPLVNSSANGYRLPTEPEWEWAARGGILSKGRTYSGSNTLEEVGWYLGNTNDLTEPVGAKGLNELGLHDTSGNVWEWVFDSVAPGATNRQLRGGSFAMEAIHCRVVSAGNWPPDARYNDGGLRVARNLDGFITVQGGTLPSTSVLSGTSVGTFQIGRFEVTWDDWKRVRAWASQNGYTDFTNEGVGEGAGENHPVRRVSWYDALKWCNAKSQMENLTPVYQAPGVGVYKTGNLVPSLNPSANGYRLPIEAEWEWAARGGVSAKGFTYSGSNNLDGVGWYLGNTSDISKPAGSKSPNELGLHDMSGNAWEWAFDLVAPGATNRQLRGGSFAMQAIHCRVVSAGNWPPDARYNDGGLRLVRKVNP